MPAYALATRPPGSVPASVMLGHVPTPLNATVPKSTDVGETNKPAVAVPVCGTKIDPASVLVIASDAVLAPLEAGWNVTATVAVAPGAIDMVDGAPTENDVAPAPVMANGAVSVTAFSRTFLIVTICDRVSPGPTDPKSTPLGAAVSTMFCGPLGEVCWKSALLSFVSCSVTARVPGFR